MSDFETIAMCILILVYGIVFYIAGRIDFLGLVLKMIEAETKELEEENKNDDMEAK